MFSARTTSYSNQLAKLLSNPILVIGPHGEETRVLATELFQRLNETGYEWYINGIAGNEIVVLFPNGSLELEIVM